MKQLFAILMALAITTTATALTVYRSADGNLYAISDSTAGPRWIKVSVVPMPGDNPTDPGDPDEPRNDRWGLIAVSKAAADSVPAYNGRDEDRTELAVYYTAIADQVEAGTITNAKLADGRTQLEAALQIVFDSAVGQRKADWAAWKDAVTAKYNSSPINSAAEAAQGLRDIAAGLVPPSARNAIDWQKFLEFFINVLLPLIIKLIGGGI